MCQEIPEESEEEEPTKKDQEDAPPRYDKDSMIEYVRKLKTKDRDDIFDEMLVMEGQDF